VTADTLWAASTSLGALMNAMQAADVAPTANTLAAVTTAQQNAARVMARWTAFRTIDLPALNARLVGAGLAALTVD
jgi:predicted ATPase